MFWNLIETIEIHVYIKFESCMSKGKKVIRGQSLDFGPVLKKTGRSEFAKNCVKPLGQKSPPQAKKILSLSTSGQK